MSLDDPRISLETGEPEPEYFDRICPDCKAQWNSLLWPDGDCPACRHEKEKFMRNRGSTYRQGEQVQILEAVRKFVPEMLPGEIGTIIHSYYANEETQVVIQLGILTSKGLARAKTGPRVSVPDAWAKEAVL